jgi:hypothetical protein
METQANTPTSTEAVATGSPTATVQIDGQKISVPMDIALDDEQLVRTLVVFFPDAANAQIEREHQENGNLIVKVTKRAGSKGSPIEMFPEQLIDQANLLDPVFEYLAKCEEQINPTISMDARIREAESSGFTLQEKLLLTEEVEEAIKVGRDWKKAVVRSFDRLRSSQSVSTGIVPTGF